MRRHSAVIKIFCTGGENLDELNLSERDLIIEKIRQSCLMDDAYMKKFFDDDIECTELVLRIIMDKDDLVVKSVKAQKILKGAFQQRSVRLDIYAVDSAGREYDIEVQRASSGASPQRARFYSALIDANMLDKKHDFTELRESVVIFITEHDVLGENLPLYKIDRYINGKKLFNDGARIVYVNASIQDANTKLGRLMHDFMCVKADEMFYSQLASRTKFFKDKTEGENSMKSVWDEMAEEKMAQGRAQGRALGRIQGEQETRESVVLKMLKAGKLALQDIAEYSGLSIEKVNEIARALA